MDGEPVGAPPVSLTAVLVINSASAMAIKGILVSVFFFCVMLQTLHRTDTCLEN